MSDQPVGDSGVEATNARGLSRVVEIKDAAADIHKLTILHVVRLSPCCPQRVVLTVQSGVFVPVPDLAYLEKVGQSRRRVAGEHTDADATWVGENGKQVGASQI